MIHNPKWHKFAEVYNDFENFKDLNSVGEKLGISVKTVRNTVGKIKASLKEGKSNIKLIDRPKGNEREIQTILPDYKEPIETLLERAMGYNDRFANYNDAKSLIDIKINVDGPFGVVGLPDHHLENPGTLLKKAFEDAKTIANHPALFAVGIGDWLDNFIVGFLERERRKNIMSHEDAWRILEHYIDILGPKLIIAVSGNHMDWNTSAGGFDVLKRMFKEKNLSAIYDTDQVRVRLNAPNGENFVHFARHKYRGNSRFNSVHAINVWIMENWQGEDVFWGGHIHVAGHTSIEKIWQGKSRVVHGIQLASYKKIDAYSKREAFRQNCPFLTPIIIHIPETGQSVFFEDLSLGIEFLNMKRKEYFESRKKPFNF